MVGQWFPLLGKSSSSAEHNSAIIFAFRHFGNCYSFNMAAMKWKTQFIYKVAWATFNFLCHRPIAQWKHRWRLHSHILSASRWSIVSIGNFEGGKMFLCFQKKKSWDGIGIYMKGYPAICSENIHNIWYPNSIIMIWTFLIIKTEIIPIRVRHNTDGLKNKSHDFTLIQQRILFKAKKTDANVSAQKKSITMAHLMS